MLLTRDRAQGSREKTRHGMNTMITAQCQFLIAEECGESKVQLQQGTHTDYHKLIVFWSGVIS